MAYLKVTRLDSGGWRVARVESGLVDGAWEAQDWDELRNIIEVKSVELGPKTSVNVDPRYATAFERTPEFNLKEVADQTFWMWNGLIHNHQPQGGGPVRKPRRIKPTAASVVHADKYGRLWDFTFNWRGHYDRQRTTVRMVNVWNATPEADGTIQMYSIRVPRNAQTAKEAVAWTFNVREIEYMPAKET